MQLSRDLQVLEVYLWPGLIIPRLSSVTVKYLSWVALVLVLHCQALNCMTLLLVHLALRIVFLRHEVSIRRHFSLTVRYLLQEDLIVLLLVLKSMTLLLIPLSPPSKCPWLVVVTQQLYSKMVKYLSLVVIALLPKQVRNCMILQ